VPSWGLHVNCEFVHGYHTAEHLDETRRIASLPDCAAAPAQARALGVTHEGGALGLTVGSEQSLRTGAVLISLLQWGNACSTLVYTGSLRARCPDSV
jgi:hypothetical protein